MDSTVIRNVYIEYLDNLTFRIRHNHTLNDTEKQISQELIFNESIRISSFDEEVEKMEQREKRCEELRKDL